MSKLASCANSIQVKKCLTIYFIAFCQFFVSVKCIHSNYFISQHHRTMACRLNQKENKMKVILFRKVSEKSRHIKVGGSCTLIPLTIRKI